MNTSILAQPLELSKAVFYHDININYVSISFSFNFQLKLNSQSINGQQSNTEQKRIMANSDVPLPPPSTLKLSFA